MTNAHPFGWREDWSHMEIIKLGEENETLIRVKAEAVVCDRCRGKGSIVNPSIDGHGLSREDFDEDPDFAEAYWSGVYDIPCPYCNGRNVILAPNEQDKNYQTYFDDATSARQYRAEVEAERRMGA